MKSRTPIEYKPCTEGKFYPWNFGEVSGESLTLIPNSEEVTLNGVRVHMLKFKDSLWSPKTGFILHSARKREAKFPSLNHQVGGTHYKNFALQPIEFFLANNTPYAEAAIIKYVLRYREKGGKQDLEKALHLIQILIDYHYSNQDLP